MTGSAGTQSPPCGRGAANTIRARDDVTDDRAAVSEAQRALRARRARLDDLERQLNEQLTLATRLIGGTTNESIPEALDAFLDERLPNGRTYRDHWQTLQQASQ